MKDINNSGSFGIAKPSTINQNEINEYRDDIRMLKAMLVYLEGNEHSAVEMVIHTRNGRKMSHAVETNANMVTALKLELADIQGLLYNAESDSRKNLPGSTEPTQVVCKTRSGVTWLDGLGLDATFTVVVEITSNHTFLSKPFNKVYFHNGACALVIDNCVSGKSTDRRHRVQLKPASIIDFDLLKKVYQDDSCMFYPSNEVHNSAATVLNAVPGQGQSLASILSKISEMETRIEKLATHENSDHRNLIQDLIGIAQQTKSEIHAIKNPFVIHPSMFHKPVTNI
jgi:hypothetical protein